MRPTPPGSPDTVTLPLSDRDATVDIPVDQIAMVLPTSKPDRTIVQVAGQGGVPVRGSYQDVVKAIFDAQETDVDFKSGRLGYSEVD